MLDHHDLLQKKPLCLSGKKPRQNTSLDGKHTSCHNKGNEGKINVNKALTLLLTYTFWLDYHKQ